jgi:hypothetical protein
MNISITPLRPRTILCTKSLLSAIALPFLLLAAMCLTPMHTQAQCVGTGTTAVTGTRTAGSSTITLVAPNTSGLVVGMPISGTGIPAGAVVTGILNANSFTISIPVTTAGSGQINLTSLVPNASWQPASVPAVPAYNFNYPPLGSTFCAVCPSLFTVDICGNQYARMYMCAGNLYTISLCGSSANWNSTISITGATAAFAAANGFTTFDDDGCGTPNGHAQVTYTPVGSGLRYIRILSNNGSDPCRPDHTLCGTLTITCASIPPPPVNDNPCTAFPLPVNTTCTTPFSTSSNWATNTSVPPPPCGTYGGYDVWFSAVVPASGSLALQTELIGASDLAMAVYSVPSCTTQYLLPATRTASSNVVINSNTTGMVVGMVVTGTGIPAGTTVASIIDGTSFTLSNNATSNTTNNLSVNVWPAAEYCNADIAAGSTEPFITFNRPDLAGRTVYVRVWPQSGPGNGGSFDICAFEPVPPPNDLPCDAVPVPVTAACDPVSGTTEAATTTSGVAAPTCGNVPPINDVWFTVQIPLAPAGVGVEIDLASPDLDDPAIAVYRQNPDCSSLTQVGCNDPAGGAMPGLTINQNGTTIVPGTVLYVRVWNKTALFGNFTICASPTTPPPNDDPCGAIEIPVRYGCLFTGYTNENAGNTPTNPLGVINVPNPTCGAPNQDVWFTVQVPNPFTSGALLFDADDGSLTDGAFAIYRVTSGSCAGSDLVLSQIACVLNGSTTAATMPFANLSAASLTPGETLYVRFWRQTGSTGTFALCAQRTDPPPGACTFTLRMSDSFGDGWNGSFVRICVDPPGPPLPTCTNYSIIGSSGVINFGAAVGSIITMSYTAVGGFQNQISYRLQTDNGGVLYASPGPTPPTGAVFAAVVDADCNRPPAPIEDCIGAIELCSDQTLASNPQSTGSVADLGTPNRGCLVANERRGVWHRFTVSAPGQLGFTIDASPYGGADYDYGLWGPYAGTPTCPPAGPPLRCSWGDGPVLTGLNWTATDFTEGAAGDSWTRYINVLPGEQYLLFVDNYYTFYWGTPFNLDFTYQPGCTPLPNVGPIPCAGIDCILLPAQLLSFEASPRGGTAWLSWSVGNEENTSHWVVERSGNGRDFESLGQVNAAGSSAVQVEYNWPDASPLKGWNYYRLRQVDKNGDHTFSDVRSVLMGAVTTEMVVYPNPANDLLNVVFDAGLPVDEVAWTLLDASGRVALSGRRTLPLSDPRMSLQVDGLDPGSYLLLIRDLQGGAIAQARFVKQ